MTRRQLLAVAVAIATAVSGCVTTQSARKPGYGEWVMPQSYVIAAPILCFKEARTPNGMPIGPEAEILERDSYGQLALTELAAVLVRLFDVTSEVPGLSCEAFADVRAYDVDDWGRPLPPPGSVEMLRVAKGDALLVSVVTIDEVCPSVPEVPRAVRCGARAMDLGAFLFTKDGELVWKSRTRHPLGEGFPAPTNVEPATLFLTFPTRPERRALPAPRE
jgi:hypothetical protein